ncbi:MAG TPA: TolC family protein [Phycisphaerae bacterium]|nr:TolC family protein [Phycisphaerales bacterium]HRX85001.1 TolC family protein [Phycisphaerae bacterium]
MQPLIRFRFRAAAAVGAALVAVGAAGCVDQQREVAVYRDVLAGHAPTTDQPAGESIDANTELSLTEAMARASRDNERIALGGEKYLQALIDKDRTFANFLPTISFSPAYFAREGVANSFTPNHTLDAPLTAQASLHTVSDIAQYRSAGMTAAQQRELLLDLHATLLLEVAQTYYTVLQAEQSVDVLANSLSVQDARVTDVRDKLAQGVARQLDLEQSKAQAAATRAALTGARRDVARARATLAFLIGVPAVDGPLVDDYATPQEVAELADLLDMARAQRRDLLAAHEAVRAAHQAVEAAIGEYYPSLSINLQAFLYRESMPAESRFASFIEANLPLFAAGRIRADVRDAWSRYRQSVQAESLLTRQVAQQVEIARIDFTTAVQRIRDLQTEVSAAREAFRIAGESYNSGLATNLDRLDAQDRLLSADLRLTAATFEKTMAYLRLRRDVGRLDGPDAGHGDDALARRDPPPADALAAGASAD